MKRVKCAGSAGKDELNMCRTVENGKPMTEEDCVDFCSFEHKRIGEKIELRQAVLKHLQLPNGVEMAFGQIIALAGDFYGIPEHPIIDPSKGINQTDSDRQQRFLAARGTCTKRQITERVGQANHGIRQRKPRRYKHRQQRMGPNHRWEVDRWSAD